MKLWAYMFEGNICYFDSKEERDQEAECADDGNLERLQLLVGDIYIEIEEAQ